MLQFQKYQGEQLTKAVRAQPVASTHFRTKCLFGQALNLCDGWALQVVAHEVQDGGVIGRMQQTDGVAVQTSAMARYSGSPEKPGHNDMITNKFNDDSCPPPRAGDNS